MTAKQIRAIIVDDEELAREGLKLLLASYADIKIVAECSNGVEAIKQTHSLKPDVLFLDIQMPHISGFDVLEMLGEESPVVVFITAHDQFAVKAFEENAVDYLLKPVNPLRLEKSIARIRASLEQSPQSYNTLLEARKKTQATYLTRILVREGNKVHIILPDEIIMMQAQDDYVAITSKKGLFLKLERLSRLEAQLNPNQFKRIHRSYIVNLDFLQHVENQKTAILKNGKKLPVSRAGYARLFKD